MSGNQGMPGNGVLVQHLPRKQGLQGEDFKSSEGKRVDCRTDYAQGEP